MPRSTAARLERAEQETHQRVLAELARRRGVLRWACYASDAEPDPIWPGQWVSPTLELLLSLPPALQQRGADAIGYVWFVEPEPDNDDEEQT